MSEVKGAIELLRKARLPASDILLAEYDRLTTEVTELKEEVYRRDCDIEGLNGDISKHFEAGWEAAADFHAHCGEEPDEALRIYLSSIDRDSGSPSPDDKTKRYLAGEDALSTILTDGSPTPMGITDPNELCEECDRPMNGTDGLFCADCQDDS